MRALVPLELVVEETTAEPANLHIDPAGKMKRSTAPASTSGRMAGEIKQVAFPGTPAGWLECDGSALLKADYPELYAAIGDLFDDGRADASHFVIPKLRNRVPLGASGAFPLGSFGGKAQVTLTTDQLPAHDHPFTPLPGTLSASAARGQYGTPQDGFVLARVNDSGAGGVSMSIYNEGPVDPDNDPKLAGVMADGEVGSTGGGQPVPTMPPYLAVRFIIATTSG